MVFSAIKGGFGMLYYFTGFNHDMLFVNKTVAKKFTQKQFKTLKPDFFIDTF